MHKCLGSGAADHVAVHGIFGIGRKVSLSLCGERGSRFWIEEWVTRTSQCTPQATAPAVINPCPEWL
jgi:hypothetical protein